MCEARGARREARGARCEVEARGARREARRQRHGAACGGRCRWRGGGGGGLKDSGDKSTLGSPRCCARRGEARGQAPWRCVWVERRAAVSRSSLRSNKSGEQHEQRSDKAHVPNHGEYDWQLSRLSRLYRSASLEGVQLFGLFVQRHANFQTNLPSSRTCAKSHPRTAACPNSWRGVAQRASALGELVARLCRLCRLCEATA